MALCRVATKSFISIKIGSPSPGRTALWDAVLRHVRADCWERSLRLPVFKKAL